MFVKPLAGRNKNAQLQKKRLSSEDNHTVASTNHERSRKQSSVAEEEDDQNSETEYIDVEDEIEEEFKEGSAQKYISPIEVREHIEKLWRKEGDLLNLMYGKFEPKEEEGPFQT